MSSIFQRPTAGTARDPVQCPNTQGSSCQSPRIQRCWRSGVDIVAGREVLDDLDIGGETGARKDALEEVMAEHGVLGDPPGESPFERVDVVDAFARVGALAEEVLIDVGHRCRIGIDPAGAGRKLPDRASPAPDRQRRRDARLQDRVAVHDALLYFAEFRPIERMGHLADQPERRIPRQPRVGIEGDDVAHVRRHPRGSAGDRHERRVGGAAQQPIELV